MPRRQSQTSSKYAIARDRESKAFELRKTGASLAQIADALEPRELSDGTKKKFSVQAISVMIKRVMAKLASSSLEDAEIIRSMEVERLDRMLLGLWESARVGHLGAVDRVLRIMERRSKLLGLDAPVKSDVNIAASWADLVKRVNDASCERPE
jgi:hypothetical protein